MRDGKNTQNSAKERQSIGHHQNQATHMGLEKHYWKEEDKINNLSSLCEMEDDTTEHVLQ